MKTKTEQFLKTIECNSFKFGFIETQMKNEVRICTISVEANPKNDEPKEKPCLIFHRIEDIINFANKNKFGYYVTSKRTKLFSYPVIVLFK